MKRFWFIFFLLGFFACSTENDSGESEFEWNKDQSTELNKEIVKEEDLQIRLYLAHHAEWKMTKTGTGLRHFIYEKGSGKSAQVGMTAGVVIKVQLLNGTVCYQTKKDFLDEFIIDKSNVETGIQEAIKLMKEGDKVRLVIPTHLAHGITGDLDKIPPLSTLVVDMQLVKLK
jgi:FKBP-type peptidyl-prolyl cis-trans isomerase FkpA